ncbi:PHP domain-containing protein [bacterium]|nr:PHP domain-containing protein [bacterium]
MHDLWADLHIHTSCSDGLLTPSEMIRRARDVGLSAVAIVDHDTVEGIPEALETGRECQVHVLPGVELSSQFQGRDVHILGYEIDYTDEKFVGHLALFRQERHRRIVRMVGNLNRLGLKLTIEEVEEKSKGSSIGRPHVAEVLMEKGYVETFQEAFQRYIGYGTPAYEEKYRILPDQAIAIIAEARGLSFLAHPGYAVTDDLILHFIKAGLDGIEVVHPNILENRTRYLIEFARSHGVLISGGSDCHGGRDGCTLMGKYNVPYAMLEDILRERERRFEKKEALLSGGNVETEG